MCAKKFIALAEDTRKKRRKIVDVRTKNGMFKLKPHTFCVLGRVIRLNLHSKILVEITSV